MNFRLFTLAALLLFPGACFAAAWLQQPGEGIAIFTLRDYSSDQYWDNNRNEQDSPTYTKRELTPFLEYGVTPQWTLGGKLYLLDVDQDTFGSTSGVGDVELFARYGFWQSGWQALSAQFLIKAPTGYDENANPNLGAGQNDVELRLLYGNGGKWNEHSGSQWYFDIEGAVRKRFKEPQDEFRLDWALGWRSGNKLWEWELLQENIFALSHSSNVTNRWADFDLHKVSPSGRYWFTPRSAFQFGLTQDFAGRNTGRGSALFGALWWRF